MDSFSIFRRGSTAFQSFNMTSVDRNMRHNKRLKNCQPRSVKCMYPAQGLRSNWSREIMSLSIVSASGKSV